MTCMTSLALPFEKELVVDLFAGGGGASSGIAEAYREPDVAVNHNPKQLDFRPIEVPLVCDECNTPRNRGNHQPCSRARKAKNDRLRALGLKR